MSQEQQLANFEGYAIVEIMGHQRAAGHVTTQYFGGVAVFRVVQQEIPDETITLDKDQWIDGERLYAGSVIRVSRPRAETFVAASSLYRMTPCTEAEATASQPKKIEVVMRAERKLVSAPSALGDEDDDELDNEWDDEEDHDDEETA